MINLRNPLIFQRRLFTRESSHNVHGYKLSGNRTPLPIVDEICFPIRADLVGTPPILQSPPSLPIQVTRVYAKIERVVRSPQLYIWGEGTPVRTISRGVFTRDAHDEAASLAVCNYYAEDTLCAQLGCSH